MNPCPCGHYGDPKRECRCNQNQVERYRSRISGRCWIALICMWRSPQWSFSNSRRKNRERHLPPSGSESCGHREMQAVRFAKNGATRTSSRMGAKEQRAHCALDEAAEGLLKMAMDQLQLSARAYDRILKVSRTIADLDGSEAIQSHHVGEAVQYRTLDRNLWA